MTDDSVRRARNVREFRGHDEGRRRYPLQVYSLLEMREYGAMDGRMFCVFL
jgi:hypothetical protein